ncbi:MAG: chemotaxis protein CheD [Nitrospirae bacterium]|nr:chemotaxis protein CheD [Nitrospirota bacterium]
MYNISLYIEPGNVFFSKKPHRMSTVVGSSVAVCLWDKKNKCGAMSHFMYPYIRDKEQATLWYGNVAMITLIKLMDKSGINRHDVVAQILGGARSSNENEINNMGQENISVAKKALAFYKIPIVAEDVGGIIGRKIVFDSTTGHIAVLKVFDLRQSDWYTKYPQ